MFLQVPLANPICQIPKDKNLFILGCYHFPCKILVLHLEYTTRVSFLAACEVCIQNLYQHQTLETSLWWGLTFTSECINHWITKTYINCNIWMSFGNIGKFPNPGQDLCVAICQMRILVLDTCLINVIASISVRIILWKLKLPNTMFHL